MRVMSYSDVRSNLKTVIDQVVDDADVTIIHRRGAENAVIISESMYSSMKETLHLLSSPANAAHLMQSIAQARSGSATEATLLK